MHTRLFYEPEKNQRLAEFFFSFLGKVKFVAGASEFVADSRISILAISKKQVIFSNIFISDLSSYGCT